MDRQQTLDNAFRNAADNPAALALRSFAIAADAYIALLAKSRPGDPENRDMVIAVYRELEGLYSRVFEAKGTLDREQVKELRSVTAMVKRCAVDHGAVLLNKDMKFVWNGDFGHVRAFDEKGKTVSLRM